MDSYTDAREVEKVKPFAERAAKAAHELDTVRRGLRMLYGENEVTRTMLAAETLLNEAVVRGVKGKDPRP